MPELTFPGLPVEETFPELRSALASHNKAVLEAPPGAGKTTLVPLALLNADWLSGKKIIMLEPRRLAARMAATRMASLLGEKVGQTVGYRIRQDKKISAQTRIEVVTEGVLTRQIQEDPELANIGLVIFDEFHERNLQGDLGLAFCLESQMALREDLRLLVMSATLNGEQLSHFLGDVPRITSQGRAFDVQTKNLTRPDKFNLVDATCQAIQKAIDEESGSLLVFLPGEGEIRRAQMLLEDRYKKQTDILIAPLFGALAPAQQDLAVQPTPKGQRKIVLATTIAETSLTIEGIRVVIDCGYKRVATYDPTRSMTKLETVRVSKASAIQRQGRAGRMEEGVCYQLWPAPEFQSLPERDLPEILDADLTPFALELANWGITSPDELMLLDLPSKGNFAQAQDLLIKLQALDQNSRITEHGKKLSSLSLHPRLAHMILASLENNKQDAVLACDIAAVLHDGPIFKGSKDSDLRNSIAALDSQSYARNIAKGALHRVKQTSKTLKQRLKLTNCSATGYGDTGRVIALAYPDRIAKQRSNGDVNYHLSNGSGAALNEGDNLLSHDFLVIAHMDAGRTTGRIFSAAPVIQSEIEELFEDEIIEQETIDWDQKTQSAKANLTRKLFKLTLQSKPLKSISPELLTTALCKGIEKEGLHVLPWDKETQNLRNRVEFLRQQDDTWPDFSEIHLRESLIDWLAPFLTGMSRFDHLKKLDLKSALLSQMDWNKQQELDRLAPTHFKVPSGSHIHIDYSAVEKPVLAVKLQEMFGSHDTPMINNGKCALQIHLLSPAGRPLQVTENLTSFWQDGYDSVKKEMRGRYPKHPWPDDPLSAIATSKTKRHLQ